jgi:hypothetical protein
MPQDFPVMFIILGMVGLILIGIGLCNYIRFNKN